MWTSPHRVAQTVCTLSFVSVHVVTILRKYLRSFFILKTKTFERKKLLYSSIRVSLNFFCLPVGIWTIRTALSVVFTCCPPAPPALFVSIFKSLSLIFTSTYKHKSSENIFFIIPFKYQLLSYLVYHLKNSIFTYNLLLQCLLCNKLLIMESNYCPM